MSKRRRQRNRGRQSQLAGQPRRPGVPQPQPPVLPTPKAVVQPDPKPVPVVPAIPTPPAPPASSIASSYAYVGRDIRWMVVTSAVLFLLIGLARFVI